MYANKHPYGKKMSIDHLPNEEFTLDENTHPLLKVAILHAQFESIHPFLDGNGRIGRIMIPLYMMQVGQWPSPILFVSEGVEVKSVKNDDLMNKISGDKHNW